MIAGFTHFVTLLWRARPLPRRAPAAPADCATHTNRPRQRRWSWRGQRGGGTMSVNQRGADQGVAREYLLAGSRRNGPAERLVGRRRRRHGDTKVCLGDRDVVVSVYRRGARAGMPTRRLLLRRRNLPDPHRSRLHDGGRPVPRPEHDLRSVPAAAAPAPGRLLLPRWDLRDSGLQRVHDGRRPVPRPEHHLRSMSAPASTPAPGRLLLRRRNLSDVDLSRVHDRRRPVPWPGYHL